MQLEGEKNKNAFFLVMGIILIIGGLFFLKNNDLKEQANKKVVPKKINVDFFNNNEKFKSLQEIDIKIKDINELKVGTNNPFQLNVPQAAGEQGDKDNGLKSENNNLQNEQKN